MKNLDDAHLKTAGIIGGGAGGAGLLAFLLTSQQIRVVFLVDRNPAAPAMKRAAQAGIPVFSDAAEALAQAPCQLLFEMTGVPAVKEQVQRLAAASGIELMPSSTWLLIHDMQKTIEATSALVSQEIHGFKDNLNRSLEGSQDIVGRINHVMSSMQMLALNASIEAAKAGAHGKGFAVVAEHLTRSVETVRKLTGDIGTVNNEIRQVSGQIDQAISRLESGQEEPVAAR